MKSYKVIRMYSELTENEIQGIIQNFSDDPEYIIDVNTKTLIFNYSSDVYLRNLADIMKFIESNFYFLIVTNFKFLDILKRMNELMITFKSAKFITYSENNIDEYHSDELNSFIYENRFEELKDELENEEINIEECYFKLQDNVNLEINRKGTFYLSRGNLKKDREQLLSIANFMFEGKKNG